MANLQAAGTVVIDDKVLSGKAAYEFKLQLMSELVFVCGYLCMQPKLPMTGTYNVKDTHEIIAMAKIGGDDKWISWDNLLMEHILSIYYERIPEYA